MSPFQKILVPTDFSPHASAALRLACDLAAASGAALLLVHVDDVILYAAPDGMPLYDASMISRVRENALTCLADARAEALKAGVAQVETKLLEGQPYREIVRAADAWNAELILIGTHGRKGFAHLFLGSVAERVVRSAHCPVITVPCHAAQEATAKQPA
ncbi:MAG TPA: universal stress protein [Polyangiales bacterium]